MLRGRHLPVIAVVAVSAALNFWALTSVGYGNAYYAAAVRGMGDNWHSFIFGSFDAGGYVTVDKPPFGLWLVVAFTKLVGFAQWSVLAPSALAATATVLLLYVALVPVWRPLSARVAAGVLAITPVSVIVAHTNNLDAVLILLMTGACCCTLRAVRTGRLRWLLAAAVAAGLAVSTKMLAAGPVVPGLFVAALWCAPMSWRKRLLHVAGAVGVFLVAALWWFCLVDLTPKADRPYVGSSTTNSAFQLAFERNGLGQLDGTNPTTGNRPAGPGAPGASRPGGAFGLGFSGGRPGPLRLVNHELGSQIGWFAPLGLACGVVALACVGFRPSRKLAAVVVFGGWFLTAAVVFSITRGTVHPYYLANVGPPLAALVGMGVSSISDAWVARRRRALVVVPVALMSVVAQHLILRRFHWNAWLGPLMIGAVYAAAVWTSLVVLRRGHGLGSLATLLSCVGVIPAVWTVSSLRNLRGGAVPYALPIVGIQQFRPGGGEAGHGILPNGGFVFPLSDLGRLAEFLRLQPGSSRWSVGVESAGQAEELIIVHDIAAVPFGGFRGTEQISTFDGVRAAVGARQIRFFFLPAVANRGTNPLSRVIATRCGRVPVERWRGPFTTEDSLANDRGFPSGPTGVEFALYDCATVDGTQLP